MKKYIKLFLLFLYKVIIFIITLVLLIILFIGVYAIYDSYQINDSVKIDKSLIKIIEKDNSFDELKKINKNIVGFINIYDTSIKYPILKGKDNIEYLNKNYKDDYSFSGSLFLDYRNNNFKDKYSIIYGHNLHNGGMLSDIKKYKNKDFFNNHLNGYLLIENKKLIIKVVAYAKVKTSDDIIYNVNKYSNKKIINYILSKSVNRINKIDTKRNYIVLSTCKSSSGPDRLILLCQINNSS